MKDRATQTLPNTGGELRCSGKVSNSCSTGDTRRVTNYKARDVKNEKKVKGSASDKWNISMVTCDTDIL